jgi:trk system potassium uptake protein TrkA
MFVLIVGGGRVGSHLAQLLLSEGHTIRVVDTRPDILERLEQELPPECIVAGEMSAPSVLEAAGIRQANVLAAVTSEDEANLVIATLARFEFNVPRVIARVNDPTNAWMFTDQMGVDVALSQADILSTLIAEEMSLGDMMTLLKLRRGDYSVVTEKLLPGSQMLEHPLRSLPLPDTCVIAAIIRQGRMLIPRGDMCFQADDEVLAIISDASIPRLKKLFEPKTNP